MGWTSQDDLINQITNNGKYDNAYMNKALGAAGMAGAWQLLAPHAGTPVASTFAGTDLVYVPTDDTWGEGTLYTGGNVSPATKHFLTAGASVVAAAGAPWYIQCIDLVGYVPLTGSNVSTTGTKTVTMTAISNTGSTGDRYPNGAGLRLFVAADTAMGANAPTCVINYLDTGGNAGATTSFTSTASMTIGSLLNTGAAANKYNPFLPLAAGDTGVSDIVSLVWSGTAHASGTCSGNRPLHEDGFRELASVASAHSGRREPAIPHVPDRRNDFGRHGASRFRLVNVDKSILEIIADFSQWKGDSYRLAALIVEQQKELDRARVEAAGFPEAAGAI
jgi:hypothetical protein